MSGRNTYDLSPKQLEIAKWKDARRRAMRETFQHHVHSPFSQQPLDIAMKRWEASRLCFDVVFKPNWRNFAFFMCCTALPMTFFYFLTKKDRDHREHLYSTGQISYYDREFKFL